jgi:cation diffusion facilitator family transporter
MSNLESEQNYLDLDKKNVLFIADDKNYNELHKKLEEGNQKVIRKLTKISIFCFVFMIIELIGGYFAKSLAIMTDAAHLLSDLSGFVISIISLYIATRPASFELTYGYHRAEVVGALASILIIWVLTAWLVSEAIQRLIVPSEINALLMLSISILGLIFNLIMGKILSTEDLPNAFEKAEKTISDGLEKVNVDYKDLVNNEDFKKSDSDKEKDNAVLRATVIHILGMSSYNFR